MRTIGFRAKPKSINFAVFDSEKDEVLNIEEIKISSALSAPAALKYMRSCILDVIREYEIKKAGIRVTESSSQQLNIQRIQIEGVIQEAFASSDLISFFTGEISSISKMIGIERKKFKPIVDDGLNYFNIDNWDKLKKEQREAVLTAIGAKNA